MRASYESIWKKYHFSSKGIRKGTFSGQNSLQKGKGWDLGTEPPHIELSAVSPRESRLGQQLTTPLICEVIEKYPLKATAM